jgi:hypothetical protein
MSFFKEDLTEDILLLLGSMSCEIVFTRDGAGLGRDWQVYRICSINFFI